MIYRVVYYEWGSVAAGQLDKKSDLSFKFIWKPGKIWHSLPISTNSLDRLHLVSSDGGNLLLLYNRLHHETTKQLNSLATARVALVGQSEIK